MPYASVKSSDTAASLSRPAMCWLLFSLGLYAAYAVYATLSSRAFYSDGAFFYVDIISKHEWLNYFDDSKHIRLLVNIVNQLPLILLTKLGVADPVWLRLAFNAPLFFGNAVLLGILWWCAKRHQSYLVWCYAAISYITTVMPSDIFAINQARLSQTIYWCILFFATAPKPLNLLEKVWLAILMVVSFRSHESIIFFGPLITLAALLGLRMHQSDRSLRKALAVFGMALVLFGVYWQLSHPVREGTVGFLGSVKSWRVSDLIFSNMFFGWSLMLALAVLLRLHQRATHKVPQFTRRLLLGLPAAYVLIGLVPLWWPAIVFPGGEYTFRVFIPFGGAALALIALADLRWRFSQPLNKSWLVMLVSAALMGQSMWQLLSTRNWAAFTELSMAAVANAKAPIISSADIGRSVDAQQAQRNDLLMKYKWDWTWPAFALAMSEQRVVKTLIGPESHGQLFFISTSTGVLSIPFKPLQARYFDVTPLVRYCLERRQLLGDAPSGQPNGPPVHGPAFCRD